jgi:transposase
MVTKKEDKKDKKLRELMKRNKELEKELARKEKALAETAALLVLKKKLEILLGEDGDD